jgi:hypothetical protein
MFLRPLNISYTSTPCPAPHQRTFPHTAQARTSFLLWAASCCVTGQSARILLQHRPDTHERAPGWWHTLGCTGLQSWSWARSLLDCQCPPRWSCVSPFSVFFTSHMAGECSVCFTALVPSRLEQSRAVVSSRNHLHLVKARQREDMKICICIKVSSFLEGGNVKLSQTCSFVILSSSPTCFIVQNTILSFITP